MPPQVAAAQPPAADWAVKTEGVLEMGNTTEFIKPLEDDHIEQMIEELLDYGSFELSSVMQAEKCGTIEVFFCCGIAAA
nr:ethylene-responsive transcription factor ERF003-like [Ipomoea trifida]